MPWRHSKGSIVRALLLAPMMLSYLLLLGSCSLPNENESAFQSGAHTNQPHEMAGPYTIKFVYTGAGQKDEAAVEAAINDYLKGKLDARVDLMPIDWGQWEDRINLMIASREKVDVIFTAQWNKHAVNVAKGAFLELSELLESYGQGILGSLDPAFLSGSKIDGGNYGVPTNKELAAQGGIIYRKDIAEELAIDMSLVHTIADLEPVFARVKSMKPDMTPIYMKQGETFNAHYIGNYDSLGDTSIPGILLKDGDSTVVRPNYETERYVETLRITRDFYQKGYINNDAVTNGTMNMDALMGGSVFSITSSLKPGKAEEIAMATGLVGKLAQRELNAKTISTSETAGSMLGISSTSQRPDLAMGWINLLHTDRDLNNLVNYGIKGMHYEQAGDGIIRQTDRTQDYNPSSNWMFGNQFLNDVWDTEDPDKWEKFRAFNEGAHLSPGLGFVFDSAPVKAEVAAVVNVDRQYLNALDTGTVDIDHVLPQYEEKLKSAGIARIIKEKQRQFDAYLAEK
ncbi:ABC transporter substrate-binding protein [Paenibacillus sp. PAMC21692]|uniref:ABC transporter substrate-binding protein n=1 Tax=Paenibacillus sp. PAMC21692 TaxID=2762320 RepID=UPI00164D717F|nr:ABC transporter substrate-binding protein [Paenibacillus sp. PAMC21692]QNK59623.1 ABC transporter substrate-binding protein [Paenibacillus sp. PAMC21692]